MKDPTFAHCDDEPWNQRPDPPQPAPAAEPLHSVHHCVARRIPIFSAPGVHAQFVYSVVGYSLKPEPCDDCAGLGMLEAWQEYEWNPSTSELRYVPRQNVDLCEACGAALRALPLGQRWQRSRKKAAVLARCIRALEAVGHAEAVEALRSLPGAGR